MDGARMLFRQCTDRRFPEDHVNATRAVTTNRETGARVNGKDTVNL
jgi:hypothetical protein